MKVTIKSFYLYFTVTLTVCYASNIPISRQEKNDKSHDTEVAAESLEPPAGLYDSKDKVTILRGETVKGHIDSKNYASLVQFYNSYCGHCRRFSPEYKKLANSTNAWRNVIKIMAIDCAQDENNDACRDYEIMAYPTLRYFSPHYVIDENSHGRPILEQDIPKLTEILISLVRNESNLDSDPNWPDFTNLLDTDLVNLFRDTPEVKYSAIIYEPENSSLGSRLILDFSGFESVRVRRTTSAEVAKEFHIDSYNVIAIVSDDFKIETLTVPKTDAELFKGSISTYLKSVGVNEEPSSVEEEKQTKLQMSVDHTLLNTENVLSVVKVAPHVVYRADLDRIIRYSLSREIPRRSQITGESFLAFKKFLDFVMRYNPLRQQGKSLLNDLHAFVLSHDEEISGKAVKDRFTELERDYPNAFESGDFIGCAASKSGLRGITCSLWRLFHFMLARAAQDQNATDPVEGLQAIHEYVKHFFGCTDCSEHFQEMAKRNNLWETGTKDQAVLWLWSAHNEVNKRLAGDVSEDPEFPKIQFPKKEWCEACYNDNHLDGEINWNREQVLHFLLRINSREELSDYGIPHMHNDDTERSRAKRMISVFSDIDMRMGFFLYAFCIGMMFFAVRMFYRRGGYKKKPYGQSFLGKV